MDNHEHIDRIRRYKPDGSIWQINYYEQYETEGLRWRVTPGARRLFKQFIEWLKSDTVWLTSEYIKSLPTNNDKK